MSGLKIGVTVALLALLLISCGSSSPSSQDSNPNIIFNPNSGCPPITIWSTLAVVLVPLPSNANLLMQGPEQRQVSFSCPGYNGGCAIGAFDCNNICFPLSSAGSYSISVSANGYMSTTASFAVPFGAGGSACPNEYAAGNFNVTVPLSQ